MWTVFSCLRQDRVSEGDSSWNPICRAIFRNAVVKLYNLISWVHWEVTLLSKGSQLISLRPRWSGMQVILISTAHRKHNSEGCSKRNYHKMRVLCHRHMLVALDTLPYPWSCTDAGNVRSVSLGGRQVCKKCAHLVFYVFFFHFFCG